MKKGFRKGVKLLNEDYSTSKQKSFYFLQIEKNYQNNWS